MASIGTMIRQAATLTGTCLTRSGCSGFFSDISSDGMPKSRPTIHISQGPRSQRFGIGHVEK
jgi:hypothetical protein